jgi:hypothetical protein
MRAVTLIALGLLALRPLAAGAQEPPAPPGPPPAEVPPPPPGGPGEAPMHPGMMHPHGPMGMMALGPVIRLRYGGLALSLRCSPRDDASACADAALKVIDRLRQMPAGEGGQDQGDAEHGHDNNDTGDGNGDNDRGGGGGDGGNNGDDQQ